MKRKHVLSGVLLFFLCGVFAFDLWRSAFVLLSIPIIGIGLLVLKIPKKIAICWIFAFLIGILRVWLSFFQSTPEDVAFYALPEKSSALFRLQGIVVNFPDIRAEETKVYVDVESLRLPNGETKTVRGKILANLPKYPEVSYGDRVEVSGTLLLPPEWEDFSYRRFLEKEGVYAYIPRGRFTLLEEKTGHALFRFLFTLRSALENTLRQKIPEPEASFAVGILLGGERGFSEATIEDFRRTGLSHLLALSGFNITILILFIFWLFKWLPKQWRLTLTILCVVSFVLLTGASASVVRAAMMGLLALFVLHSGAQGQPLYILLWSIFLMIVWNPFLLLSDVSLQLSIGGVLGLILFVPVWEKWLARVPGVLGLRDGLQTTMAAQVMTVPLIAFYFQRISLVSPLANLAVAPLIPFAMLCALFTLFPFVGSIGAFCAYGVLHLALAITGVLARISWADTAFSLGVWGITSFYLAIFTVIYFRYNR